MNNKFLLLINFLLIFLSCQNKSADLEKFESVLGPEKSKVLTELTDDFEKNYLAKKYPDCTLKQAYLKFMEAMARRKFPEREEVISKENEKKYKDSGLINEKYMFPDSVWIEEYGITTKWEYINEKGEKAHNESFRPVNSKDQVVFDSILAKEKERVEFNKNSDFVKALDAVKKDSPFINFYYVLVTHAGLIGSDILFPEVRDKNMDISGPVERRVIVLHLIY